MNEEKKQEYSKKTEELREALTALRKGIIFKNTRKPSIVRIWDTLRNKQEEINRILYYFSLELVFKDEGLNDGYAFVQPADIIDSSGDTSLDCVSMGPTKSWIMVLLRKAYYDKKLESYDTPPMKISRDEFYKTLREYTKDMTDEDAFRLKVDQQLRSIDALRIIRLKEKEIEIRSVIESIINASWLEKVDEIETAKSVESEDEE